MSTWADERAAPRDNRPRRWIADSVQRWRPWEDPELPERVIETASDAQLARLLNLAGWPVTPCAEDLGPWSGGVHWP